MKKNRVGIRSIIDRPEGGWAVNTTRGVVCIPDLGTLRAAVGLDNLQYLVEQEGVGDHSRRFSITETVWEELQTQAGGQPISDWLRAAVRAAMRPTGEWTQLALAERSGVPQPNISDWLAGKTTITLETADRLASAMGIQVPCRP